MKFKVTWIQEIVYEPEQENYKSSNSDSDLTPEEMLKIDMENILEDPLMFFDFNKKVKDEITIVQIE